MVFPKHGGIDIRLKLYNPDINSEDPIIGLMDELQRRYNNNPVGFVGFKW